MILVLLLLLATTASADTITFSAPESSCDQEPYIQTGYFDVLISNSADSNTSGGAGDYTPDGIGNGASGVTNTNGTDLITGITVEVETTGAMTFIATDDNTGVGAVNPATYLYLSNSIATFPTGANLLSSQDVNWNDFPSNTGTNLVAGTPLGLMRVEYSIPANAASVYPLTIVDSFTDPAFGSFWGDSGDNVNIPEVINGLVVVYIPEPSSIALLLVGILALFSPGCAL